MFIRFDTIHERDGQIQTHTHTHTHTHAHTHRQTDTHKHSLSNVKEADSNCRQCEHGQRHLYVARPTEMNVIRTKPNEMTETM